MSTLARRIGERRLAGGAGVAAFAAKVVGVGLGAGLLLVVCQFVIDAWFRAIR
ncbi:MAG TPA: hypothetical protein VHG72_16510 [Polyangia bacterium]|nr:hypothetical protein [Polyangia bacterium]